MNFFLKLFGIGNNPDSPAFKAEQARKLHGEAIRYVTERINDNDDIVGRDGYISVVDDKIIIDTSGERLFSCDIKRVDTSWLMSGNGVIISGPNSLEDGRERTLTVHFVYHRK